MSRVPSVEREGVLGGLTYQSAVNWFRFLADEAYFEGDALKCSRYMARAEEMEKHPAGSIHSKDLEEAIKKWASRKSDEN
jgi:hypothetical protein